MRKLFLLLLIAAMAAGGYYVYENDLFASVEEVVESNEAVGFDQAALVEKARKLAAEDYEKPKDIVPDELKNLSYDQHRDIRFTRENGPWFNKKLPFEVQFFHLGSMFNISVPINEIVNGKSSPIKYSSKFFDYGKNSLSNFDENLGYAGFRLHNPLNTPKYYDELISFLGASYFRALGKGQKYGLSARGLAIDTAVSTGEEFPIFKEFWIERPKVGAKSVKVYALLDSPSVSGAYSFVITPGGDTKMEVEATIFTRKKINKIGIAPLTSMFLFGENNKHAFDDHRPEVHDSDGLLVWNGNGEWIWRPLDNSKYLRISSFVDKDPKGFGLMQRDRNPEHYLDFEANYEQRPSAWVEPVGDWGDGMVQLVEIPSIQEIHDNIVAYWIPSREIKEGKEYSFKYNIYWCDNAPFDQDLMKVQATYFGVGGVSGMLQTEKRKFVVDFVGEQDMKKVFEDGKIKADVSVSEGKVIGTHMIYNPLTKGITLYMDYEPAAMKTAELRMLLRQDGEAVSEVWSYQWLP